MKEELYSEIEFDNGGSAPEKPSKKRGGGKAFAGALFIVLLLGLISFFTVRQSRLNYAKSLFARSQYYSKYTFEPLDDVSNVKFYAGNLAVYYPGSGTGRGLIRLDGKKLTEPVYTDFNYINNGWHNTIHIAYPEGEPYPKYVRISDGTVDIKQYQGGKGVHETVMWSSGTNTLSLHDDSGYVGDLSAAEVKLADGLYAVTDGRKWGYVDEWLDLKIPLDYEAASDFSNGMGAVCIDEKWGYIDEEGKMCVDTKYAPVSDFCVSDEETAFEFRQGAAPVKATAFMGIIDKKGKTVVDFDFEVILPGLNGKYIAKKDGVWGIISTGKAIEQESTTYADSDNRTRLKPGWYKISTNGSSLNMRSEASQTSDIVAKIPNGTKVEVTKATSDWAFITYYNAEGWVSVDYITETEAPPETTAVEETSEATENETNP
ncbi:MAG: WG repeat-containing protein [Clostridia bacterium]|nr:WG repeat-containing protein [Clostridia bacterium]